MNDLNPELLNHTLVQSANELADGWQANNYSLLRISETKFEFFDFEERLVQAFSYRIEDNLKIVFQPDESVFGQIRQQTEDRLSVESQDGILHFIRIPDTIMPFAFADMHKHLERTKWVSNQMGFHIKFSYLNHDLLDGYEVDSGVPRTEIHDNMEMHFSIKQPFGKSFLLMYADRILVDVFPIHLISEDHIEFYASLTPLTIKVLTQV